MAHSRSNRLIATGSTRPLSTLSATNRLRADCVARYTTANPPCPMTVRSAYPLMFGTPTR